MSIDNQAISWPGWETVRLIGRGSFGTVYEIQRDIFGEIEKAALKVISIPQNASDIEEMYSDGYDEESITSTFQSHLKSIVAEYSMMRKMNGCANIVNCDDVRFIQHDDGIGWDIFIKMELLTPLTRALPAVVPEETVLKIARDICTALVLCKKHEIIHRDIKPQNIFVSPNGDYKLGDFGIAKTVEKTMGGTKIGTYKYMAPEVYNNRPYGSGADLYSLGLVLYWLLNERRMPFLPLPPAKLSTGMDETARARRLSGEKLPEPKHGSTGLKAIVMKACAYRAEDRYASAADMLQALDQITQPSTQQVREETKNAVSSVFLQGSRDEADAEESTILLPGTTATDCVPFSGGQSEDATIALFSSNEKTQILEDQNETILLTELTEKVPDDVPADSSEKAPASLSGTGKNRRRLPILIGAIAAVLVLVAVFFFFNHKADPVTLVNKSWENGSLIVIALDSSRLKIQLTDNRPQEDYKGLGTCWMISLKFGEKTETDEPFSIVLISLASRQKNIDLEETGNVSGTSNLRILKRIGDYARDWKMSYVDFFDIEQNENTYCAVIEVPEWFDVSLAEDLTRAMVYLASASGGGKWKNVLSSDTFEVSSGACGKDMTYQLYSNGSLIISGQGEMNQFYDSRYVPWRTYRDDITSVTLEEGITSIGDYAFSECKNLTSVSLPASIVEIGKFSFDGCSVLSGITIPENVIFIEGHAFYGCDQLTTVVLPASVAKIGDMAFSGGRGTKEIYVMNAQCEIYQTYGTLGYGDTTTIYGYSGSTAQTYAEKYNYGFSEIGES